MEPQGEYADAPSPFEHQLQLTTPSALAPVESLAPAGGPEAAFAAFQHGADAIYLGLQ